MSDAALLTDFLTHRLTDYYKDLSDLCAIDSGPNDIGGANRVNDWIAQRLQHSGFTVTRHAHQTVGDIVVARKGVRSWRLSPTGKAPI